MAGRRRHGALVWIAFATILPLFMAALLVGPRVPAAEQARHCVGNMVSAAPAFGLSLNCDAFLLLNVAREPWKLLTKDHLRQSRPLMILPATALRPLFTGLTDAPAALGIAPAPDVDDYFGRFMPDMIANDFAAYVAYILLNIAILVASFAVFLWLVLGDAGGRRWSVPAASVAAVAAIGGLLVANDVVKAFMWAPHVQFYNILVPLLAVAVLARPVASHRGAAIIGFASGIGVLAYPLFIVVAGAVAVRAAFEAWRMKRAEPLAPGAIAIATAFIAPLAWFAFVMWRVASFYSEAARFDQVVWITQSLAAGTFLAEAGIRIGYTLGHAGRQASSLVVVFVPVLFALLLGRRRAALSRADLELCVAALVISIVILAFHAIIGTHVGRTAYGALPPLIVFCAVLARVALEGASARLAWGVAGACGALMVAELVHVAAKGGPYS